MSRLQHHQQLRSQLAALVVSSARFASAQTSLALISLELMGSEDWRARRLGQAKRSLATVNSIAELLLPTWPQGEQNDFSQTNFASSKGQPMTTALISGFKTGEQHQCARSAAATLAAQPEAVGAATTPTAEWKQPPSPPAWPRLDQIRPSGECLESRQNGIGGSDANIILSGDRDKILALWREKRGEQPAADLSTNLAVMLGCWTEAFNRHWYENVSGHRVDEVHVALTCPMNPWRRCTLDGYVTAFNAVWEAKHTSAFAKAEEVLERYMPQLQHNMAVARCERAILSVIFGNHKFEIFEVASDWIYQIELLQAEVDFWDCVRTGREPVPAPPPAPPKPVGIREVCLDGHNGWAVAAADWLQHREAAKMHAAACIRIKDLVEPDVARAFGHGIEAKRSKAGGISIRELAQ